ncbi:MAG: SRPBCC family protein [Deltaproteobacteria bacterium]|nr:SRPBCC family protein [Deltaproteobacteria bacterium]
MEDRIEKSVDLKAPIARVWRALTDHEEFGQWFQVRLDGPFAVGEISQGQVTYEGCSHMKWVAQVEVMETERRFSFHWCPLSEDASKSFSNEPKTLVEFTLEEIPGGTRLLVSESGFASLPEGLDREGAWRRNSDGWTQQVQNIAAHVHA